MFIDNMLIYDRLDYCIFDYICDKECHTTYESDSLTKADGVSGTVTLLCVC